MRIADFEQMSQAELARLSRMLREAEGRERHRLRVEQEQAVQEHQWRGELQELDFRLTEAKAGLDAWDRVAAELERRRAEAQAVIDSPPGVRPNNTTAEKKVVRRCTWGLELVETGVPLNETTPNEIWQAAAAAGLEMRVAPPRWRLRATVEELEAKRDEVARRLETLAGSRRSPHDPSGGGVDSSRPGPAA